MSQFAAEPQQEDDRQDGSNTVSAARSSGTLGAGGHFTEETRGGFLTKIHFALHKEQAFVMLVTSRQKEISTWL